MDQEKFFQRLSYTNFTWSIIEYLNTNNSINTTLKMKFFISSVNVTKWTGLYMIGIIVMKQLKQKMTIMSIYYKLFLKGKQLDENIWFGKNNWDELF